MQMAVACFTKRPAMYPNILANILSQTRRPDVVSFVAHREPGNVEVLVSRLQAHGIAKVVTQVAGNESSLFDVQRLAYSIADGLMEDGIISQFEDDDWYGPGYLAEVEETFSLHPDAIATGKPSFILRCIGKKRTTERTCFAGSCSENGNCGNVAGPTISIRTSAWRAIQGIHFCPDGTSKRAFPDMAFIDALKQECGEGAPLRLYSTGSKNFVLQRYQNETHDHSWKHDMPEFR
jgi:hypothetical protein